MTSTFRRGILMRVIGTGNEIPVFVGVLRVLCGFFFAVLNDFVPSAHNYMYV